MTQSLPQPSSSAVPEHPVLTALDAIETALVSVVQVNPAFMRTETKALALRRLARAEAQVVELRMRIMADADDVAADVAARDVAGWYSQATRTETAAAKADAGLAADLDRRWTAVAAAMRTGDVSLAQARTMARSLQGLAPWVDAEVLEKAEAHLVALAADHGPRQLAALGRKILEVVAPEVAEEVEARRLAALETDAEEGATLRLRRKADGRIAFTGEIDEVSGTRFAVYLEAFTNPRKASTLDPTDGASGDDGTLTSHPDPVQRLPRPRRLGQAFCTFLETVDPQRLPVHGGNATQIVVTIDYDALCKELGTAEVLTTAAIPGGLVDGVSATSNQLTAAQTRRLACNAQILPVVLGGKSQILDYGYNRRLFSPAQQRALLLRDRTCRAEGCDVPGTWAEAHHWLPWGRFGKTDIDNAVLLCSHHHHRAHDDRYLAVRLPNGDVRFNRRR